MNPNNDHDEQAEETAPLVGWQLDAGALDADHARDHAQKAEREPC